jgi:hypothetical protein
MDVESHMNAVDYVTDVHTLTSAQDYKVSQVSTSHAALGRHDSDSLKCGILRCPFLTTKC